MMKYLAAIASLAVFGSMAPRRSQDERPQPLPDLEAVIAAEIAEGAPTETTGMESTIRGTIRLDAYLDTLRGGNFRLREVVLLPGAKIRVHGHNQRPAIAYVLEGELIEHRNDSAHPRVRRKGDSYLEGPDVVHWIENVSTTRVRVISVDIAPNNAE